MKRIHTFCSLIIFSALSLLPASVLAEIGTKFKIEAGMSHYDLDIGEDTSNQPLDFNYALPYGAAEFTLYGKSLFASARYLTTAEGDIEDKPFSQTLMGPGSRSGDFTHNQLRLRLGYRVVQNFSLYLGYERSQSDLEYSFEFPDAGDTNVNLNPGDTFRLDSSYEFSTSGPLLGMSYIFTPEASPLFVSLNLDVSELTGKLDNTNAEAFVNNDLTATAASSNLIDRSAVASRVGLNFIYVLQSGSSLKANMEVQHKDFGFNSENIYFAGIEYGF